MYLFTYYAKGMAIALYVGAPKPDYLTSLMHPRPHAPGSLVLVLAVRSSCIQYISVLLSNLETCGKQPPLRLHFNAVLCPN